MPALPSQRFVLRSSRYVLFWILAAAPLADPSLCLAQDEATPPTSLVGLIDPELAEQLQLTPEQRQQIDALVSERAAALGAAAEEERSAIEAQFEQRLGEVLTATQRGVWQALATGEDPVPPERKLRFTFRFQPWNDVLSWFANEAGLSLVLDAPPPGTFNYSDTREYTVSEAIDLLNGVLLTKGYTLIRRDRMMMLVNLEGGIPSDLIPRVTLEELDARGQFEMVQVLFTIGGRDADEVNAEIAPLIGEHGSSVALPKTKQVLVTDTAGKMRAIRAVIESIPEPKPEPKPERKEPEKPVLQVYPLASIDATAAVETIRALMPEIKVTHDPRLNQLNAFATPTEQAGIQSTLDAMKAEQPDDKKKQLSVYPLEGAAPPELLEFLRGIAPAAQLAVDPQTGNLAVFANQADQTLIGDALVRMQRDGDAAGDWRVEVYSLSKATPADLVALLATVVPDAKLAANTATGSLVALARADDQRRIAEVVEQIESDEPAEDRLQLRLYPLEPRFSTELLQVLANVAPQARVNYSGETERLSALARPADHEQIRSTIEQLVAGVPGLPERQLKFYPVDAALQTSVSAVLAKLVERADVTYDAKSEHLTVLASAEEHDKIQAILEQFVAEAPAAREVVLEVYELTPELRAKVQAALAVLTTELGDVRMFADEDSGNLVVWANPEQHARIAATIAELDRDVPADQKPHLATYHLELADPTAVMSVLQTLLPEVRFVLEPKSKQIVAWATPTQHELIATTIQQMDSDVPEGSRFQLKSHPLGEATAATAMTMLATLLPEVQLVQDEPAGALVAWARESDHDVIRRTVEGLQPSVPAEERPTVVVYQVPKADPVPLVDMLQAVVPQARLSADRSSESIAAWATPEEHEIIRSAVEQLEGTLPPDKAPQVVVYPMSSNTAVVAAYRVLSSVVPDARLSYDPNSSNLVAWGTPDEHALIGQAVEQMEAAPPADRQQELAVYSLDQVDARSALQVLQGAVPDARLTSDRNTNSLLVWATREQQKMIQASIDQLRQDSVSRAKRTTKAYRLQGTDPSTTLPALQALVPDAQLVADVRNGGVVATALPEEHEQIAAAIAEIEQQNEAGAATARIYTLEVAQSASAYSMLTTLYSGRPEVRFSYDPATRKLAVWATAAEHEVIQSLVEQIEQRPQVDQEQELVVYPMHETEPTAAITVLQSAIPEARFASDPRNRTLLVWASKEQHAKLSKSIEQLQQPADAAAQRTAQHYRLTTADPTAAVTAVMSMVPTAQAVVDQRNGGLVVTALPAEHEQIAAALAEIDGRTDDAPAAQAKVYPLAVSQATSVYSMLSTLFATRPEVRLSLDPTTQKLVVWASPEQQATVQSIIDQIEGTVSPANTLQLEVHPLGTADPTSVTEVLTPLFLKSPEVKLIPEPSSNQLVALARPQEQATIRTTIEQLQAEAEQLEVFQLSVVDPFLAELSIGRLFGDPDDRRNPDAPRIDSDPSSGQLIVRGSPEQVAEIRELLGKMGEPMLALASEGGSTSKIRTIPIPGRSARQLVEELEKLWPQVRPNPIRIVVPSAVAPTLRESKQQQQPDSAPPTPPEDPSDSGESADDESSAPPTDVDDQSAHDPAWDNGEMLLALADADAADEQSPAETQPSNPAPPPAADNDASDEEKQPAPIIIAPGTDQITISSDDTEALDQLEMLLRSMTQGSAIGGREFTVFPLKNANARSVAETVEQFFDQGFFGGRGGSSAVTIVPDQRLNALIVQASPNDLRTIEGLLETLDSTELADTLIATKPTRIPVKNTKASDILVVLEDVYETQLRSGGAQLPIPSGVPRELASVLQQISAASSGPLMTLSVDEVSNSIIVLAPQLLVAEVQHLIESLDEAAANPARTVRVVPLTKTNAEAVEDALQLLLDDDGRSSRSRRRSR